MHVQNTEGSISPWNWKGFCCSVAGDGTRTPLESSQYSTAVHLSSIPFCFCLEEAQDSPSHLQYYFNSSIGQFMFKGRGLYKGRIEDLM